MSITLPAPMKTITLTTLQRLGLQAAYNQRNKAQRELVEALTELGLDPAADYYLNEATGEFWEVGLAQSQSESEDTSGETNGREDSEPKALARIPRNRTPRIKGED